MKARTILALLLALTLVLSACGGEGDSDATDATPTAVTEVEPANTPTPTPAQEATPTTAAETTTVTETKTLTETEVTTETEGMTETETETETLEGTPTTEAIITDTEEVTETGDVTDVTAAETTGVRSVVRASELLGYGVQNFEGEELGSINDAMVSLQDGCIDYIILSFGGILGLGDSLFLIPWRVITIDPQNERLIFNVEPEVLNEAPVFDVDNLPDLTAEDWDADVVAYWENVEVLSPATTEMMTDTTSTEQMPGMTPCAGAATETAASEAVTDTTDTDEGIAVETPRIIRLSELLGFDVTNAEGEDLGAIEDIMIDWRQNRIVYPIFSFGGFLGLGEKWFVIPLDQITLDPIERRLVFDVEPEQLENAPGFDALTLPDTADPSWDEKIRRYWLEN